MSKIASIRAREILDSRGNPTVEAEVKLDTGGSTCASIPSGASTGKREALELRDKDPKRYGGKGVLQAVGHIRDVIAPALKNQAVVDAQQTLDKLLLALDGSENKSKLGANAVLAVSLACARAAAMTQRTTLCQYLNRDGRYALPVPMMNIINGGAHADNNVDIQEFMIIPAGLPDFAEALRCGCEIFHTLAKVLKEKSLATAVGDEGGFAPDLQGNEAALQIILQAVERAGYRPGEEVYLGLDIAASELYQNQHYRLASENKDLTAAEFTAYLQDWTQKYPILSIEDGMAEDDWQGWRLLTDTLGEKIQLVGDDVFVTNSKILRRGIDERIANAILIKYNQIGTLSETIDTVDLAQKNDYATVISHRSGETEDTAIADLAVALHAGQIKTGSLCRTDRVAKYNRLLRLAEKLGDKAAYAGKLAFKPLL